MNILRSALQLVSRSSAPTVLVRHEPYGTGGMIAGHASSSIALAEAVVDAPGRASAPRVLNSADLPLDGKIEIVAALGFGHLRVCIVKTQSSSSDGRRS